MEPATIIQYRCLIGSCSIKFLEYKLIVKHLKENHMKMNDRNNCICCACGMEFPEWIITTEHMVTNHTYWENVNTSTSPTNPGIVSSLVHPNLSLEETRRQEGTFFLSFIMEKKILSRYGSQMRSQ